MVRIQGEEVRVQARTRTLDINSGHADAPRLVGSSEDRKAVCGVFLVHGNQKILFGLAKRLTCAGQAPVRLVIPQLDQRFTPTRTSATASPAERVRLPAVPANRPDWHNARADLLFALTGVLQPLLIDAERVRLRSRLKALIAPQPGPDDHV